jgi:hypothetical protein
VNKNLLAEAQKTEVKMKSNEEKRCKEIDQLKSNVKD